MCLPGRHINKVEMQQTNQKYLNETWNRSSLAIWFYFIRFYKNFKVFWGVGGAVGGRGTIIY